MATTTTRMPDLLKGKGKKGKPGPKFKNLGDMIGGIVDMGKMRKKKGK